jgi:excisionase family DNA binding protein
MAGKSTLTPELAAELAVALNSGLTLGRAAERFGISERTIRRWIQSGRLEATTRRPGRPIGAVSARDRRAFWFGQGNVR